MSRHKDSNEPNHVCPVERAGLLDGWVRKLLHSPEKITKEYISPGSSIIDMGCGPGFFTIPMAQLAGPEGRVTAVDMQQPMLDIVAGKIERNGLAGRITLHKCESTTVGLNAPADFILAFYMIHEAPSARKLLEELRANLKSDGKMLVVEPKFHVSKKAFNTMIKVAENAGLQVLDMPKKKGGLAVLFGIAK